MCQWLDPQSLFSYCQSYYPQPVPSTRGPGETCGTEPSLENLPAEGRFLDKSLMQAFPNLQEKAAGMLRAHSWRLKPSNEA